MTAGIPSSYPQASNRRPTLVRVPPATDLLLGSSPKARTPSGLLTSNVGRGAARSIDAQADDQINTYIRGKVAMSLLVGLLTALSLGLLQVDLWLVFGLLAFWLNL